MFRIFCITVAVLFLVGCEKSRPVATPASVERNTPEGQFNWIMQRLERAVLDFRPSQRAGLKIGKPKINHEIFPPDDKNSYYTARVTIESETIYVHDKPLLGADREKKRQGRLKQERERRKIEQESEIDDPLAEKFMQQMEEIAAKPRTPTVPDATIDNPRATDLKVYDLAYLQGQWELRSEPETDHERLWFQYALGTMPTNNAQ